MKGFFTSIFTLMFTILFMNCNLNSRSMLKIEGPLQTKSLSLSPFTKLSVHQMFQVQFLQADSFGIAIEAPASLMPLVTVELKDHQLSIAFEDEVVLGNIDSFSGIKIMVYGNALEKLALHGLSSFNADSLYAQSFEISVDGISTVSIEKLYSTKITAQIEGVSKLNIKRMHADTLDIEASGMSVITIGEGTTVYCIADIAGTTQYNAEGMISSITTVEMSGMSNASIQVADSLSATLSGTANLNYIGNPAVKGITSGVSKITKVSR